MIEQSAYVRKIGDGQYEYGVRSRSTNFRKRPDVYTPLGVSPLLVDATVQAEDLQAKIEGRK